MIPLEEALVGYRELGYARLGVIATGAELAALGRRVDAIMLGEVRYEGMFFQRDTDTGSYADLTFGKGWEGPTMRYRKLEKLELDPLFRGYLGSEPFREVTRAVIGPDVSLYRAVIFNKSGETGGSEIPFHQDGGRFWGLDRDPILQAWTALDDAPIGGGCIEVVPGSHLGGLATPLGGVVPAQLVEQTRASERVVALPAEAGEVILIHNHLWHRSGRGRVGLPRRALTVCYMDAETRCLRKKRAPRTFFRVF